MTAASELLARMRAAWEPFRARVAGADRRALEGHTPAGWTYKEMLAHVAAWHDLTARRLTVFHETGETEPPTGPLASRVFEELGFSPEDCDVLMKEWHFDRFNAAVVNAARSRDLVDVLGHLDRSFDAATGAVARLSDQEVARQIEEGRSFVEAVVAGNTFDH